MKAMPKKGWSQKEYKRKQNAIKKFNKQNVINENIVAGVFFVLGTISQTRRRTCVYSQNTQEVCFFKTIPQTQRRTCVYSHKA